MIGSPMARSAWAKTRRVLMRRHIARIEMHLRDARIVAADEAIENLGEEQALLGREPAHDAEIDGDEIGLAASAKRLP